MEDDSGQQHEQHDPALVPPTAGPWVLYRGGNYVPGYDVCELMHSRGMVGGTVTAPVMPKPGEEIANGYLIAGARDLLEALQAMLDAYGNCGTPPQQRAADLANAALAKARGRS